MKNSMRAGLRLTLLLTAICVHSHFVFHARAQGTAFTYQGFLTDQGAPAGGSYDLRFTVYDALSGGATVGTTVNANAVGVTNGLFTVTLDPGANVFTGAARFLNIAVRPGVSAGPYTNVVPRQPLTATPYAITAGTVTGLVPAAQITGTVPITNLPSTLMTNGQSGVTLTGTFNGNFTGGISSSPSSFGSALTVSPTPLVAGQSSVAGDALTVVQGDHYAATANGAAGLRIYDVAVATNPVLIATTNQGFFTRAVVGGQGGILYVACDTNGLAIFSATNPAVPALLARTNNGGQAFGIVTGNGYCFLSATPNTLIYNVSNPAVPVLVGQITNTNYAPGLALPGDGKLYFAGEGNLRIYSVTNPATPVLLGQFALPAASVVRIVGNLAFVIGGTNGDDRVRIFDVSNPGSITQLTQILQTGARSVAVAGNLCYVSYFGQGIRVYDLSNILNPVSVRLLTNAPYANDIAIAGPYAYTAEDSVGLRIYGIGDVANFTAGSSSNGATGQTVGVTISGGGAQAYVLSMNGQSQSVGGPNLAGGDFATIGGGVNNVISNGSLGATIAGGVLGRIGTNSLVSVIGGGFNNSIGDNTVDAVIGGGDGNTIGSNSYGAVISGGGKNSIGNNAQTSTIAGGNQNVISNNAQSATIPGGNRNTAGASYSLAAGNNAKANHPGSFVWADSQSGDFASTTNDQVSFRAQGGVRFTSASGGGNTTVAWTPGNASWSFTSDRNTKDRVAPIDPPAVLEKLKRIPIHEWSYIGYEQRHIGPMAQDFHAQFPLNANDKALNDADLHGVALAAIQGLNQKVEQRSQDSGTRIEKLETENTELKRKLSELEAQVRKLSRQPQP